MSKPKAIKILIADDHSMLIDGLKDILSDLKDIDVVGEAGTGEESVRLAKSLKPDIVLMDIKLPGISGIAATELIKKDCPGIKVLMVSSYDDDSHILDSFRAGADGYIPKYLHVTKIIESIYEVHKKGAYVPEAIAHKLVRSLKNLPGQMARESAQFHLTPMEIRILEAIKDGKQTKEAAQALGIKEKTVRNHLNSIYLKLAVKNRTQAISLAINRGIISQE